MVSFALNSSYGVSVSSQIKKADKHYKGERYDEALDGYTSALLKDPDNPVVQYNRAVTLYRKNHLEDSGASFLNVLATGDEFLEKDTMYNMGNVKYREAESAEESDPKAATKTLEPAI